MSDEKYKSKEIKDEELDKVSGGRSEHMDPMGDRLDDSRREPGRPGKIAEEPNPSRLK
jgi:hypothetical protein